MVEVRGKETKGKPAGVAKIMKRFSKKFKPDVSRRFWRWIRK
jgi:hypothetical protein